MVYYRPCPDCGSNLDPGEECGGKRKTAQAATCTEFQCETHYINKYILPQNKSEVKECMKMGYRNDSLAAVLELERQRLGPDEECDSSWDYVWDNLDVAFNDWRDECID